MEQHNMMPNGMGGNNNMMNMGTMQRPQMGNPSQQLHASIMERLRNSAPELPTGWQQTLDPRERASRILQMVTQLQLLENQVSKCMSIAESFETRIIRACPSKEQYFAEWNKKLHEITQKRSMAAQQQNMGMGMPPNNMGNMHNMNMQQNAGMNGGVGMNMNGFNMGMTGQNMGMGMPNQMGNMGMHGMNQQGQFQSQNYPPHLQRPMQPSPMPPQQQQQNGSVDPAALQNPQMNHNNNAIFNGMGQPTPQQTPRNPAHGVAPPGMPTAQDVRNLARQFFESMNEDQREKMRAGFVASATDQQRQQAQQQFNGDPLQTILFSKARSHLIKRAQQQAGMNMNGNQALAGQVGQQGFDYPSLMGQQANAIKSQESGGEVVPASNNANGGRMNGQQSGNQQQMGGNPQMMSQAQFNAMQQEKLKREQMQKKHQMAQAMAQQAQLRGQPGGLNAPNALNGGQVNSPAMNMNMLNRPMAPPGQSAPSTPHQNQPNRPPQTPGTNANQLAQHHQNMLNQNQFPQGQNQMDAHQRMMNSLPEPVRQKLSTLTPQEANNFMARYLAQRNGMAQPGGPGMSMNGGQMVGQEQGNAGMMQPQPQQQQGMGNGMPGFNSQPPQNQPQQGSGQLDPTATVQQRQQQQMQNSMAVKQRAMDVRPFPRVVTQSLNLTLPDTVNNWGKLKSHIVSNQNVLPANLLGKIQSIQHQWFDQHPEEMRSAIETVKQLVAARQNGFGGQQRPPNMPMPNGQAPQAQMVAPAAQMQQQPPNAAVPEAYQMTARVAAFRRQFPTAAKMSDDEIRNVLMRRLVNPNQASEAGQANGNADLQQNMRNSQMQRAQMMAAQQQLGQRPQQPPQPNQSQNSNQNQPQPHPQGQKRSNNDDVVEIPNPNVPQPTPQQMPPNMPAMPNISNMPNMRGVPTREDLQKMTPQERGAFMKKVAEMNALRNAQAGGAPNVQPPNQQQNQSNQSHQPPNQQSNQPQGQQQTQAPNQQHGTPAQPAQTGHPPGVRPQQVSLETQQELNKLRAIHSEVKAANPKGPPVQLDQKGMQTAQELLRKLFPYSAVVDKTFLYAVKVFGEDKVREAIKIKVMIAQNAADANGTINGYLGVTLETLRRSEQFIRWYLNELKQRHGSSGQSNQKPAESQPQTQAQATAPKHTPTQPQPPQPKPAPAAKEKQPSLNRKNSQHGRKASQNKAPPAPTENKTFDWKSPTGHGVPKYEQGRSELTADKLKFPPAKKRKTGDSQSSTPAAQSASPQVGTAGVKLQSSPEQIRKMPPQEPAVRFRCHDTLCADYVQGFDSEHAVHLHNTTHHMPVPDPMKFLCDTVDEGLAGIGLDTEGLPLPPKVQPAVRRAPAAQKVSAKKEAQVKQESATPATPASTGKNGIKTVAPTTNETKPAAKPAANETSLYDALCSSLGYDFPAADPDTTRTSSADDTDSFLSTLHDTFGATTEDENSAYIEDWVAFRTSDDAFAPRRVLQDATTSSDSESSVVLTPASSDVSVVKDGQDIGEAARLKVAFSWDAFGEFGEGGFVPEALRGLDLGADGGEDGAKEWKDGGYGGSWGGLFGAESGVLDDGGWGKAFGSERGF